jgi:hypothetical protein
MVVMLEMLKVGSLKKDELAVELRVKFGESQLHLRDSRQQRVFRYLKFK